MIELENININDLNPAQYNPRIMPPEEMQKLKHNIETFGLIDPILIDLTDNNTVIGGHQRLEVLKELDNNQTLKLLRLGDLGLVFKETSIKIKDKNDQKAMNLSLNKISGEFDYNKVNELITGLAEEDYLIELTGFDEDEILNHVLEDSELTAFGEQYSKDENNEEYNNLIEQYSQKKESTKNGNWFYIEYYGDDDKFKELSKILENQLDGLHEINPDYFYNIITNGRNKK